MHAPVSDARRTTPAFVLALALLGALAWQAIQVMQQVRALPHSVASAQALSAAAAALGRAAPPEKPPAPAAGPAWQELSAAQKKALAPLASRWAVVSELQKRHWLAIAKNFPALPAAEQQRLHARMAAWASLSAQQRSQARLNFAVTNQLSADSKRAQWEAYQALSEEEKNRLAAAAAARRSMGAATALHPVAPNKLVQLPASSALSHPGASGSADNKSTLVETAPVDVPMAVPSPLPPLPPLPLLQSPAEAPSQSIPALSDDAIRQYSH